MNPVILDNLLVEMMYLNTLRILKRRKREAKTIILNFLFIWPSSKRRNEQWVACNEKSFVL